MNKSRQRYRARKAQELSSMFSGIYRGKVSIGKVNTLSIAGKPGVPVRRLAGAWREQETTVGFLGRGASEGAILKQDKR